MIFTHQFVKHDGFLVMSGKDNVAVVLNDKHSGDTVDVSGNSLQLRDDINFGHKFAITPIEKGAEVIKYGEVIGVASENILPGQHVHVHNVKSLRGGNNGQSSGLSQ